MTTPTRLTHPLCGADLHTLAATLRQAGAPSWQGLPRILIAALAAAGRLPFTAAEYAYMEMKSAAGPQPGNLNKLAAPPIFILGHWRSGTTHLYNILGQAPQWGTVNPFATALPWDILSLVKLFRPLLTRSLPAHRYIDNIPVTPNAPQEDEIALANMTSLSYYHALYFPEQFEHFFRRGVFFDGVTETEERDWQAMLQRFYHKLTRDQGGRRLIIKNPVYTARPQQLAQTFPGAKFIHIHRDPRAVFVSMRNFYEKLFAEFALQDASGVDIDEIVFATYERMMDQYLAQTAGFPASDLIEISYDELQQDPLGTIAAIYQRLGLNDYDHDKQHFSAYLATIKTYKKNVFARPAALDAQIEARWDRFFEHWGYRLHSQA